MAEVSYTVKLSISNNIIWFYNPESRNVNFHSPENLTSHNHVRLSGGTTVFHNAFNIHKPINNFFHIPRKFYLNVQLYRPAEVDSSERSSFNLTLYVPRIMFQCVDKPTRCNTSYEWSLLSIIWLYMFRIITSPSSGASSHKLYNALVCSCRRV